METTTARARAATPADMKSQSVADIAPEQAADFVVRRLEAEPAG
jgi:hypothetical protein